MNVDKYMIYMSMSKMMNEENISYEALKELHELISTLLNNYKLSLSLMLVL